MKLISFTATAADNDNAYPVTADILKRDTRFKSVTIDEEVTALINDLIQIYIKRDPRRLSVQERWLMSGENELLLRVYPIDASTLTIMLGGEELRYELNPAISRVFLDDHICGKVSVNYTTQMIPNAIQAMRVAGKQLLANIIGLQSDNKRTDVDAISIAGIGSVNYDSPAVFTPDVKQLLYPYRVKSI